MFNVVAHTDRSPGAILIRAVEPLGHHDILQAHRGERVTGRNLTNGPAKLAQALDITGDQNDVDLCSLQDLTIVEGALAVGETLVRSVDASACPAARMPRPARGGSGSPAVGGCHGRVWQL